MTQKSLNKIEHLYTAFYTSIITIVLLFGMFKCTEEQYVFGYNKDFEQIYQKMFEVDSLMGMISIKADSIDWQRLDSLNAELYEN
mgnify:FL=1